MLIEREIKELANKKEYVKVFNYFHDEYTNLLKEFLKRHDVEVKEDDCLIDYIIKTRIFMPKYTTYTIPITNAMYNEEDSEEMKFALLMNSYKMIIEKFSE